MSFVTETLTAGHLTIGMINQTPRGFEAFGPGDVYVATFATLPAARRALTNLHEASAAAQMPCASANRSFHD